MHGLANPKLKKKIQLAKYVGVVNEFDYRLITVDCKYFQMEISVSLILFSFALIFIPYRPQSSLACA